MNVMLPRIAARLFNTPLMVDAGKAVAIVAGIGGHLLVGAKASQGEAPEFLFDGPAALDHVAFEGGRPSERAGELGFSDRLRERGVFDDDLLQRIGSVAVIPIEGSLVHKGGWIGSYSGETSYQGLQAQVGAARRNPRVRGVVFEVDSFGGEVSGAFDAAEAIAELSAEKPTLAILTDNALSAGYLLASAARQIVLPETGFAGSIGVICVHVDYSRAIEQDGMRVTVLSSGERKADGSPFKPLGAEVTERWQADLDAGRDLFADTVARYRGRRLSKQAALDTEAESYRGQAAVDAGLADGVVRPSLAFDEFVARVG